MFPPDIRDTRLTPRQALSRVPVQFIRDDGIGFDTGRVRTGLGLIGIEERVKELGGSLAVRSSPNRGTLLHVEIPLAGSNC